MIDFPARVEYVSSMLDSVGNHGILATRSNRVARIVAGFSLLEPVRICLKSRRLSKHIEGLLFASTEPEIVAKLTMAWLAVVDVQLRLAKVPKAPPGENRAPSTREIDAKVIQDAQELLKNP